MALATVSPALADDAYMVDVVRSGGPEKVNVSAVLKGSFTKEIKESIDSGAPVTFTYFVELKRIRTLVWNETARELVIKRLVKFDTLRKVYLTWEKRGDDEDDIVFDAELSAAEYKNKDNASQAAKDPQAMEPMVIKEADRLERWMTRLENLEIAPAAELKHNSRYYIRARCEMKSIKLIPPFNYILFFVSFFNFETGWETSSPFYLNGAS